MEAPNLSSWSRIPRASASGRRSSAAASTASGLSPRNPSHSRRSTTALPAVLLRELGGKVMLSALWLYPPGEGAATTPRTETFMLHLILRGEDQDDRLEFEYDRLAKAVIEALADRRQPGWPEI
jgi:hypothetical protein